MRIVAKTTKAITAATRTTMPAAARAHGVVRGAGRQWPSPVAEAVYPLMHWQESFAQWRNPSHSSPASRRPLPQPRQRCASVPAPVPMRPSSRRPCAQRHAGVQSAVVSSHSSSPATTPSPQRGVHAPRTAASAWYPCGTSHRHAPVQPAVPSHSSPACRSSTPFPHAATTHTSDSVHVIVLDGLNVCLTFCCFCFCCSCFCFSCCRVCCFSCFSCCCSCVC